MRLLLIRHGQSTNNHRSDQPDGPGARHPDPPLTPRGRDQAARVAEWLTRQDLGARVTHLHASLTTRAVQTAAPLAAALNLNVHGLSEAYECGGLSSGPEGNFAPVMGRDHPSLLQECAALQWPAELRGQAWDGGCEPWESDRFARRAALVTAHLAAAAPQADVMALITHHDFAQYLLADLLDVPALRGGPLTFPLNNASMTYLEVAGGGRRVLHWLNRTDHLPPDLLTL